MDRILEFVSHHPWLAAATAAVAALVAVYEMRARAESLISVSPQELIRLMNQGAVVFDLRPAEQYQAGHLAGARPVTGEQLLQASDTLKKHKEKAVVVYDDSGRPAPRRRASSPVRGLPGRSRCAADLPPGVRTTCR